MVSNLAKLAKSLRENEPRSGGATSAFREGLRQARERLQSELADSGRAELVDANGNRFLIQNETVRP